MTMSKALDREPRAQIPGAEWPNRGEAWTAKHDRDGVPNGGTVRVLPDHLRHSA
jgi:hypothetical protein